MKERRGLVQQIIFRAKDFFQVLDRELGFVRETSEGMETVTFRQSLGIQFFEGREDNGTKKSAKPPPSGESSAA